MKKEMTFSFAVTLGTLATATVCHAEEAIVQPLPEDSANATIAPLPTRLSTVETAKPTLDRTTLDRTTDRISNRTTDQIGNRTTGQNSNRMTDQTSNRMTDSNGNRSIAIALTPEFSPLKDEALPNLPTPKSPALSSPILDSSIQKASSSAAKPTLIQIKSPELTQKLDLAQTSEPTQLQNLTDKQTKLEQELESLKQQLKKQETQRTEQQNNKSQAKPHADLPDGLQIYSEAIFLKPRSDLMMDFARVDPGNTFLATGGPIAALEYRQSTAWRVNARYRFAKSPWELGASYTRLGSDDTAIALKPTNGFLFSTLTAPRGGSASADSAIATAKIDYTVLDLDTGYHIQPSKNVDLKLIAGLRIANVGQNMAAVYTGESFDPIPGTFVASQQFRGLGPRVGAEGRVALGSGFSVYGRGSGSLLFGDQESDLVETFQGVPVADFKVKRKQTVPIIDAAIGLDWSAKLGQSGRFTVGVGYEYQHWFNLTRNVRYTDASAPGGFVESKGDLSMQGFFAKAGVSWTF